MAPTIDGQGLSWSKSVINYSPDGMSGIMARADIPSGIGLTPNPEVCSAERGNFSWPMTPLSMVHSG